MGKKILFCFLLLVLAFSASSVFADETLFNPSFYSGSDIVADLPSYWLANYVEIMEYMKKYTDFSCEHYQYEYEGKTHDQVVCESVNNNKTRDVVINFFFEGDHAGMTGLQQAVFTISTPNTKDIQDVFEYYWLNNAFPWHKSEDEFYSFPSLIFHTYDTVIRFDFPNYAIEGLDYMTVDLWDANYSRLGVG